jgi:hypothetical protein
MNTGSIIKQAETYSAHTGKALSTIASYSVKDGKFFDRLNNGGSCTLRTADNLIQWFSENWPEDLEWPADTPRPKTSKEEAA